MRSQGLTSLLWSLATADPLPIPPLCCPRCRRVTTLCCCSRLVLGVPPACLVAYSCVQVPDVTLHLPACLQPLPATLCVLMPAHLLSCQPLHVFSTDIYHASPPHMSPSPSRWPPCCSRSTATRSGAHPSPPPGATSRSGPKTACPPTRWSHTRRVSERLPGMSIKAMCVSCLHGTIELLLHSMPAID